MSGWPSPIRRHAKDLRQRSDHLFCDCWPSAAARSWRGPRPDRTKSRPRCSRTSNRPSSTCSSPRNLSGLVINPEKPTRAGVRGPDNSPRRESSALTSPGLDGMTREQYELNPSGRLADLHRRVHTGTYRATPSRAQSGMSLYQLKGHWTSARAARKAGFTGWSESPISWPRCRRPACRGHQTGPT
jgi:hypothetical protein